MENTELKQKFDYVYENVIKPKLNGLAVEQMNLKEQNRRYVIGSFLCIAVLFLFVIFLFIPEDHKYDLFYKCAYFPKPLELYANLCLFFILLITAIFMSVCLQKSITLINDFRKKLKNNLLKELLTVFGDWELNDEPPINVIEINATGLFSTVNMYNDDCLTTKYNNIPFNITETQLYHVEGKHRVTDFNGIIIKTKINKDFFGMITGLPVRKENLPGFISLLQKETNITFTQKPLIQKKITDLNSTLYESFDIYSTDHKSAETVITTEFEEAIKCINELFETKTIKFAFMDGCLYLFLDFPVLKGQVKGAYGFFEVGNLKESITDEYIYDNLFKELSAFNSVLEKLAAAVI